MHVRAFDTDTDVTLSRIRRARKRVENALYVFALAVLALAANAHEAAAFDPYARDHPAAKAAQLDFINDDLTTDLTPEASTEDAVRGLSAAGRTAGAASHLRSADTQSIASTLWTLAYLGFYVCVFAAGAKSVERPLGKPAFGLLMLVIGAGGNIVSTLFGVGGTGAGLMGGLAITLVASWGMGLGAGAYARYLGRRWTFALWGLIPLAWIVMLFARPAVAKAERVERQLATVRR